jgi:hypothetical protein
MKVACQVKGIASTTGLFMGGYFLRPGAFGVNPGSVPLYYSHSRKIGACGLRVVGNELMVHGRFTLDLSRPADDELFTLFKSGLLRCFSIAYAPDVERLASDIGPTVVNRVVVTEVSICEQGANAAALIQSRSWRPLTPAEILNGG